MNLRVQLARIKRSVLKKPFMKDKRYPPYWFNTILGKKEAFIVQIGSNDGKTGDPLNQLLNKNKQWKALFVEPVPYLFEQLKSNYVDVSRFQFENVAINEGNKLVFYWVDPKVKNELDNLPFWYNQLGSFDKNHIINELGDHIVPYIISEELDGITLPALFSKNKIEQIDILHIDTEGYDWKILSQLDLEKHSPQFILYEKEHLSEKDLKAANDFLIERYHLFQIGIDTLAVNRSISEKQFKEIKSIMNEVL